MSEEIKEIFNKYGKEKYNDEYCLEFETYIIELQELKKLYDYITDLQEDNQRLKEIVENLTTMTVCGDRKQIKNTAQYKLEQAQSRIDKAIEIYENRNSIKFKKQRFMEDKDTGDLMYDILKGE